MNDDTFDNRMIPTSRNNRQSCQLKYSRHGALTWDKWTEYDCIFFSYIDANGNQQNQLELHSKNNHHKPNGKTIDLQQLQSLTCVHGNTNKDEPKDIIILKIASKRHRLGFDSVYDYSQWKSLLDGVYNSTWDLTNSSQTNDSVATNMFYESVNARRYRVRFADLETQEILVLPSGECQLVFDVDKLVLEQYHDKQYTFPRSTIRTMRLIDDSTLELELGSRAPVQGFIRFRFCSPADARSCYLQWNEGMLIRNPCDQQRISVKQTVQQLEPSIHSTHVPLQPQPSYEYQPPRPPPKNISSSYYNYETSSSSVTTSRSPPSEYPSFQTLV
ncbi:unnamed protein product [Adineta ricciae]|uniref:IRS-type PTB domain-containing protein n=1 Tax=Adineta ricciae TaxID=249248 RepID=A0A813SZ58_ADIRI|nr:unnamed protein product [Adineta ricciae]CAF1502631.1 unnamed protein product [Adineta ricciae]